MPLWRVINVGNGQFCNWYLDGLWDLRLCACLIDYEQKDIVGVECLAWQVANAQVARGIKKVGAFVPSWRVNQCGQWAILQLGNLLLMWFVGLPLVCLFN